MLGALLPPLPSSAMHLLQQLFSSYDRVLLSVQKSCRTVSAINSCSIEFKTVFLSKTCPLRKRCPAALNAYCSSIIWPHFTIHLNSILQFTPSSYILYVRNAQIFKKSRSYSRIPEASMWNETILEIVENSVARATWRPNFVHPFLNWYLLFSPSQFWLHFLISCTTSPAHFISPPQ